MDKPLNLDKGTELADSCATGVWRIGWYTFADGGELVATFVGRDRGDKPPVTNRGVTFTKDENRKRAARRAAVRVRRLTRACNLRYMWTLTFPAAGIQCYETAMNMASEWVHREANAVLKGRYLFVGELHPGGHGWHIHMLCADRLDVDWVRRRWTKWLQRYGYEPSGGAEYVIVNVQEVKSTRKVGAYVAKYVSKAFSSVPDGRQRYRVGEGLEMPMPAVFMLTGSSHGVAKEVLKMAGRVATKGFSAWFSWSKSGWDAPPAFGASW